MLLLQSSSDLNQTFFANWKSIIKNFPDIALFQVLQVSQISRKTQNCPLKTSLRSMKLALDRLTLKNFKNITALDRHPLTLRTWRTHATTQQLPFMSQYTFMWNHYLDYWTLAAVLKFTSEFGNDRMIASPHAQQSPLVESSSPHNRRHHILAFNLRNKFQNNTAQHFEMIQTHEMQIGTLWLMNQSFKGCTFYSNKYRT